MTQGAQAGTLDNLEGWHSGWIGERPKAQEGGDIYTYVYVCFATQSCPTPCNPMDCSPPGSSVPGDSPGENTAVGCHALLIYAYISISIYLSIDIYI